jgi:hypothetical protein
LAASPAGREDPPFGESLNAIFSETPSVGLLCHRQPASRALIGTVDTLVLPLSCADLVPVGVDLLAK